MILASGRIVGRAFRPSLQIDRNDIVVPALRTEMVAVALPVLNTLGNADDTQSG